MPSPLRGARRGRLAGLAGLVVVVGALAVLVGSASGDRSAAPAPELEPAWTIPGLGAQPAQTGTHHWMTYQAMTSGIGWGTTSSPGPVLLVDARTGSSHQKLIESERFPCLSPQIISDSGVTPILWAAYRVVSGPGGASRAEPCQRITVLDASSGRTLWKQAALDLDGLSPQRVVGADDEVVAFVDHTGTRRCFGARDGAVVEADDPACRSLGKRLAHTDLPDLVDPDGKPVPLPFSHDTSSTPAELGRTEEVLLVRDYEEETSQDNTLVTTPVVRAHDLETGETLWQDELEPFAGDSGWTREETYFVAPSGIVRVSYRPRDPQTLTRTPMVLTAVGERTGKDRREIARVGGAWFSHQFGDITVALTDEEKALNATISGFVLPEW